MQVQPVLEMAVAATAAGAGAAGMAARATPSKVVTPSLDGLPAFVAGWTAAPALAASGEIGLATIRAEKKMMGRKDNMMR